MLIEILFNNGKLSSGELKKQLDQYLLNHDYNKTAPDTYWERLKQLSSSYNKQSKYVIQPVLQKMDEGRGKKVLYSLNRDAKIRWDLNLPILKSESTIERAYRLLFYYIVFYHNPIRKLKDEDEYNALLENLFINKNELELIPNLDFKEFKITKWIHPESEIDFTRKDYPNPPGNERDYEYSYILPGISPSEFHKIREPGRPYQQINFRKDEVIRYFKLLEKRKLIKKIKSLQLEILNEERYTIVDNSLKELLAACSTLEGHVYIYLEYIWKAIGKPTNEERIWYEHLWGKNRTNKWFIYCNDIRREYKKKNKNQVLKETQERLVGTNQK